MGFFRARLRGQRVVTGLTVEFTASADHSATDPSTGDPLVSSYELRVYDAATDTLQGSEDVGKPTPVGGVITVTGSDLLSGLAPGSYLLRVATLGPNEDVAPDEEAISYPVAFTV